jgi:hypothetical protein
MLTIKTFGIDLTPLLPPLPAATPQASLRRLRSGLRGRISDDDLATLDTLTGSVL